ncbi:MAG: hypothetical protein Q7U89_03930 [Coriobacteriia bacterium]|nr:hypothetical protein [Coriobacteriia bacterium]
MRSLRIALALVLLIALPLSAGCRAKTVTVKSGEIVLCTEGEIVSDTTEELQVPADEVGEHSVRTRVVTCDLHTKLAKLYADAQAALDAGDSAGAAAALTAILKLDVTYRKAGTQLAEIKAGKIPASDGTQPTGPGPGGQDPGTPGDDQPTGPVLVLASYTPDSVAGLVGQGIIADPFTLTRDYLPGTPGTLLKAVIVAEQFKDAAGAKAALDGVIKASYPDKSATLSVGGRSAYYGQSGRVVAVAFVEGAVLVVIEGAATGDDGSTIKAKIVEVAGLIGK